MRLNFAIHQSGNILLLKIHLLNTFVAINSLLALFPCFNENLSANHHQGPEALLRSFCFAVLSNLFAKMGFAAEQLKTARMLFASGVVTGVGRRTGHQAQRRLVSCNDVGLRWRKAGWVSSALFALADQPRSTRFSSFWIKLKQNSLWHYIMSNRPIFLLNMVVNFSDTYTLLATHICKTIYITFTDFDIGKKLVFGSLYSVRFNISVI